MRRGFDKRTIVVLAVDFHQRHAERPKYLHADRLIVDESAGAAVRELDTPHDHVILRTKIILGQHPPRRMIFGDFEGRDHLPLLGALAHQSRIAARAERERKRIEQNRFAGAGFAGQRGEARTEIDVETLDQNDIANGKAGKHGISRQITESGQQMILDSSAGRMSSRQALSPAAPEGRGSSRNSCSRRVRRRRISPVCKRPCTTGCPGNCGPAGQPRSAPHR